MGSGSNTSQSAALRTHGDGEEELYQYGSGTQIWAPRPETSGVTFEEMQRSLGEMQFDMQRNDSHEPSQRWLDTATYNPDQNATFPPNLANKDNTQAAMASKKQRKVRGIKTLLKTHEDLSLVRDEILFKREEIQNEHRDLSYRLEQVRLSEEDLISEVKHISSLLPPGIDLTNLNLIWSQHQSNHRTFQDRLGRIDQLFEEQVKEEARVIVADLVFMDAAKKTSRSLESAARRLESLPDIVTKKEEESPDLLPHESPLVQGLELRRSRIGMYDERRAELEWEHREEEFDRELLRDRGDEPEIPDVNFNSEYEFWRNANERDNRQNQTEFQYLESECLTQNYLQPGLPLIKRSQSESYLSNAAEVGVLNDVEVESLPFVDNSSEQAQNSMDEEETNRRRSHEDFLASMPSPVRHRIADWVLEQPAPRRLSTGTLNDISSDAGLEMKEEARAASLRRAKSARNSSTLSARDRLDAEGPLCQFHAEQASATSQMETRWPD